MATFKEGVNRGFVKAMWCGSRECEDAIKDETGATTRCIPFDEEQIDDKCICCGEKANIWYILQKILIIKGYFLKYPLQFPIYYV